MSLILLSQSHCATTAKCKPVLEALFGAQDHVNVNSSKPLRFLALTSLVQPALKSNVDVPGQFGWQITAATGLASNIQAGGPEGILGHITSLGHEPEHYTMFYVDVEDVPAALDKAAALGGKTLVVFRTRLGSYCDASPARNP